MQSASCVSVKCEPKNFRVTSCDSGNLWVASYLLSVSCKLWVDNQVVSREFVSLYYLESALSVYIVLTLHIKEIKSNKVIWYIPSMI